MTADEYQDWTASTDHSGQEFWYYALGLAGEAGETVDAIKKGYRHYGDRKPMDVTKVIEELGDTLWYAARIASSLGVRLSEVMERNQVKIILREAERVQKCQSQ